MKPLTTQYNASSLQTHNSTLVHHHESVVTSDLTCIIICLPQALFYTHCDTHTVTHIYTVYISTKP